MLSIFKKLQPKQNKFFTINISATGIKCLTFYKDGGNYKIIGRGQHLLEPGIVRNSTIVDKDAVIEGLQNCITQATQNVEGQIKDTIIGITGDLCQEVVTTAKITRGDLNAITIKEIENFQKKIVESAYLQIQKDYAETTGNSDTDFDLITSSIVYTKIDNQKTDSPIGKTGQNIELALYTAFCPKHHLNTLKQITKKLGLKLLAVSSQSFALLKALKHSDLEHTDLVTMQIGSDFTCACVVFGGAVVTSKNLHIGAKNFVEQISQSLGFAQDAANKMLRTYLRGELGQSESELVKNCLEDVLRIWLDGVELMFKDFSGVKTFAPFIYIFDEGSQIPDVGEYLSNNPWTKSIPFKALPKIVELDVVNFTKLVDATGSSLPNEFIPTSALAFIYEDIV